MFSEVFITYFLMRRKQMLYYTNGRRGHLAGNFPLDGGVFQYCVKNSGFGRPCKILG